MVPLDVMVGSGVVLELESAEALVTIVDVDFQTIYPCPTPFRTYRHDCALVIVRLLLAAGPRGAVAKCRVPRKSGRGSVRVTASIC